MTTTLKYKQYLLDRISPTVHTTIYHVVGRKCACKGTGLVPPNSERKDKEPQAYCPMHRCKRYWPQLQSDGSVQFKELTTNNRGLK